MASISNDPGGRRRILFFDANGKRRALRLGKVSKRQAETIKGHVEHIVAAQITRTALARETTIWVAELDDAMHARLAAVGLIESRTRTTLGPFLTAYIAERT